MKVIHRVILHSIGYFLHITDIGIRTVYRKETVPMDGIGTTTLRYSNSPVIHRVQVSKVARTVKVPI